MIISITSKACPDLIRSMFVVKDGNGDIVNGRILLQYHISSGEDEVELKVGRHGNSKRKDKAPFYPTVKSTKELMKQQLKDHALSQVYKNMVDMAGGPSGARTPGELPRSIKQVSDFNEKCQPKEDPVDDLMNYARHKEEQVVLLHEDIPVDLWVLGTDTMCKDVGRLSSSESSSHPMSIDPTFNMGQYEVTPIVYKHLLLASKRTGESPIFLGPTMLHHKKNVDTYKVFAATCVASCKGLEKAKGYITDGEAALDRAWKTELPKATHLRCLRHFKGNCQKKLRELGVREEKSQKFFLDKVFGVHDKTPGLVDCETMKEVKQQLETVKEEFDTREKEILNKKSTYEPRFSKYLWDSRHIIGKSMALEPRRKAGMPLDGNGIPLRPYTNASEAMNNVMAQAKKRFLRDHKKPENSSLSKLEFTKHVFEEIHSKQQEQVKLSVIGLSDEYKLSDTASQLFVQPDIWFDWTDGQRNEYIQKFNSMTVDDVLKGKGISIHEESDCPKITEFKDLSEDVTKFLEEKTSYKEELAGTVKDGALVLLNSPSAIQQQPTLDPKKVRKFDVASRTSKHGRVECTVNQQHVTCQCPNFKSAEFASI